jgi:hypothetical protein
MNKIKFEEPLSLTTPLNKELCQSSPYCQNIFSQRLNCTNINLLCVPINHFLKWFAIEILNTRLVSLFELHV